MTMRLVWFFLIAFAALVAVAEDTPQRPEGSADANVAAKKEKLDFYRRRLREYRLIVDGRGDKPCELVDDPLTRWDNPISQNADSDSRPRHPCPGFAIRAMSNGNQ